MHVTGQTILVVDDHSTNRELVRAILEAVGYTTTEASNGEEALKVIETEKVDAIISDVLMPRMDGYRLCYEIRKSAKYSTLPFIFLTAVYTSPGDEKLAAEVGADKLLKKPFSSAELLATVQDILRDPRYRRRRDVRPADEKEVLNEYNDALVIKLEERNNELQTRTEELQKLSRAVEQTADHIMITNKEGVIEYVNPEFERATGYTKEFAIGRTPAIIKSGKHDAIFYGNLWKTILSGKAFRAEFINRKCNGELYYELQTISPLFDEKGNVVHFVSAGRDVSDARRAEEQLRVTYGQLRHLLEHSPAVIYTLKIEGERVTPVVVSENVTRLLGFTVQESSSFDWWASHLHPDDREKALASIRETIEHGSLTCGYRIRHKEGHYLWIEDNRRLVYDANGKPAEIVGVWTDVTKRTEALSALDQLRKEHTLILSSLVEGVYGVNLDGKIIFENPSCAKSLGWEVADLLGRDAHESIHPTRADGSKYPKTECPIYLTMKDGRFRHAQEEVFWRKDGTSFPVEYDASPLRSEEGRIEGAVVVFSDNTERKQAEINLRESEEQFRLISENVADLIAVVDLEGRWLYNSPSYSEILGEPDTLYGTDSFEEIHPEDRERVKRAFQETLRSGAGQRAEFRFLTKSGDVRFIESHGNPIRDKEGNISRLVVVSRDVTEKKKLEQQILRNQRMESIGTLAGGIAHDLNNVLSPILMAVEILKRRHPDQETQKILQTLESSAERGAGMVKQVLTFARGMEGERAPLQLAHLIREMEKILRETFPKSIQLKIQIPKDLWTVSGDATQLHQVLLNLSVNARDAMPKGGTLTISAENFEVDQTHAGMQVRAEAGPHIILGVADTGTGIPPEMLSKIFDPFFTTKEIGKGTGLGLSTVDSIVKNHHGFMNVYSEMGRGTQFRLYLPAHGVSGEERAGGKKPELPLGHGELILLVDDEASIRDICKATLEAFGYRVATAADGVEALAIFVQRKEEIKLVITDMMMPLMDGRATIHAIRRINPTMKMIATSGLSEEARSLEHADLGVQAFMQKPYTAEKLLRTVNEVLAK